MPDTQSNNCRGQKALLSQLTLSRQLKAALLVLVAISTVLGQTQDAVKNDPDDDENKPREKRGSLVIAPIPISSPAFGSKVTNDHRCDALQQLCQLEHCLLCLWAAAANAVWGCRPITKLQALRRDCRSDCESQPDRAGWGLWLS